MKQVWGVPYDGAESQVARARRTPSRRLTHTALGLLMLLALGACADKAAVDDGRGSATLSGATSESPASPTSDAESDSPGPMIDPGPGPDAEPTPIGGRPWNADVTDACQQELAAQGIAGLEEVAQTANDGGMTSFWAAGKNWVVCDSLEGKDAPTPALLEPIQGPPPSLDGKDLALATTVVKNAAGEVTAVRFAAGGKLRWPVYEMTYEFPDGHSEKAAFVRSDDGSDDFWWSVSYTATDGVLLDQDTDPADLKPLYVSVISGPAWATGLPWQEAVCAQTNFSC